MIKRSTRLALMALALTACASNPSTSTPPLPKPIVSCGEHVANEQLGPYPTAPSLAGLDDHAKIERLEAYSAAQSLWAIGAAGVAQRNAIKRNGTTSCLDDLRRRGVIQ
jgi:hypothetical protein